MEPVTVIAALGAIAAWLNLIRDGVKETRSNERKAIQALYRAATRTRSYVSRVKPPVGKGDDPRDPETEAELSKLWMDARLALSRIDYHLAEKCEVKSGYWTRPHAWSSAEIRIAKIQLDTIFAMADHLRKEKL